MSKQPHGTTTTRDDNGATLRLLLPCQLTCALPSRGVDLSMTCGCTLHGFLTHETPCTPLPIPADYPDPCRGYGFLEGTGIGHREVTRGLPVPITSVFLKSHILLLDLKFGGEFLDAPAPHLFTQIHDFQLQYLSLIIFSLVEICSCKIFHDGECIWMFLP